MFSVNDSNELIEEEDFNQTNTTKKKNNIMLFLIVGSVIFIFVILIIIMIIVISKKIRKEKEEEEKNEKEKEKEKEEENNNKPPTTITCSDFGLQLSLGNYNDGQADGCRMKPDLNVNDVECKSFLKPKIYHDLIENQGYVSRDIKLLNCYADNESKPIVGGVTACKNNSIFKGQYFNVYGSCYKKCPEGFYDVKANNYMTIPVCVANHDIYIPEGQVVTYK